MYGIAEQRNVPVRMADGTVLRANLYRPTDPRTGQPATGRFPVVMVQTPYGKDTLGAASGQQGGAEAGSETGAVPYLIKRGYIDVVAEVRGTGDSGGTFNLLDPIQAADGAALVRWAARLPGSSGRVGLYGPSYMGLNQFMTAAAVGPHSPLRAIFPIVAGNDTYRDIVFDGGLLDAEFDVAVVTSIFGPLEEVNPVVESQSLTDLLAVELAHAPALARYNLNQILSIGLGGEQAYDEAYWQVRAPRNMLARVVANGIPAYMIGGWFDLYQRGTPLNYSGLQNAWAGRSVSAPMTARQPVTGRYQLRMGPWYHLDAGIGYDIYALQLRWFDRWLKGAPTGIEKTRTPLHLHELESNRWLDASRYPLEQATPTTLYLGARRGSGAPSVNDGSLTSKPPASTAAADTTAFSAASSPCGRSLEQWGAGAGALAFETGQLPPDPCTNDDRTLQAAPGALTYTTAPFTQPTVLAGPVGARIYATSTRPEVELVATLEDVWPNGRSVPLTSGALLGSFRALDRTLSWFGPHGRPLLPYHPYTRASVASVLVGKLTRYDVEIFPTVAALAAGHRLRLTLTTSDTPHLLPTPAQAQNLAGGVYRIERSRAGASYLELPLVSQSALHTPPARRRASCPRPTGRLSGRRLGPLWLGMTRAEARRRFTRRSTRGRSYMDFFCLNQSGIRVGYPSPKLLGTLSRSQRGRVQGRAVLVLTANRRYTLRGVRLGARVRTVASQLKTAKAFHVGLNYWYLCPNGSSRGVLKVRRGIIEELGIADKRLTSSRIATWRFLKSFSG